MLMNVEIIGVRIYVMVIHLYLWLLSSCVTPSLALSSGLKALDGPPVLFIPLRSLSSLRY